MLNVGDILQGRYRVLAPIKSGGMGAVYEVFDQRLKAHFALKEAFVQSADERAQFEREAHLLAQLDHPVLPRVLDHFSERGRQFLVMERIPGDDLETLLESYSQPFAVELVLAWAEQLLDALEYLHSQNPPIIHRDIKPANLKPLPNGRIKLLDFGIAKTDAQTVNVAKAYSLAYSPLEQFSAATHTDARSDLYALGATLYHLLTNQAPPSAPDRARGQPLLGPQSFNPTCPPTLAQVILRAMALKPEQRFQSATEFRAAIGRVRDQTVLPVARRPWWLVGAAAAAVVVIFGVGAFSGLASLSLFSSATPGPPTTLIGTAEMPEPSTTSEGTTRPVDTTAIVSSSITATPSAVTQTEPASTELPAVSPTEMVFPTLLPSPTAAPLPTTAPSFGPLAEQHPARVTASDTAPTSIDSQQNTISYAAKNVVDGQPETAWRVPGDGVGQWLMLEFDQPVRVSEVRVLPGYAKIDPYDGTNRFTQNRRVQRARLEFSDGSSTEVSFADDMRLQSFSLNPVITTFVRIVVLQTTAPAADDGRDFTPISEVVVIGQAQMAEVSVGEALPLVRDA